MLMIHMTQMPNLISKPEGVGLMHCNYSKAFIEYSNDMDDIYENIEEYNPNKERKKYWSLLMIWL